MLQVAAKKKEDKEKKENKRAAAAAAEEEATAVKVGRDMSAVMCTSAMLLISHSCSIQVPTRYFLLIRSQTCASSFTCVACSVGRQGSCTTYQEAAQGSSCTQAAGRGGGGR